MATQEKTPASNPRTVERAARVLRSALDEMEYCLLQALDAVELGGTQSDLPPSALAALRNLLSGMRESYEAVDELIEGAAARAGQLRLVRRRGLRLVGPQ